MTSGQEHGRDSFTLIELLCVMAIIGTLVGLIVPAIWRMKTQAKITEARSDVRQIVVAWNQYLLDYHRFPALQITEMGPDAMDIMRGNTSSNNTKGIGYMDFRTNTQYFCDPWATPGGMAGVYHVVLDGQDGLGLDGRVAYPRQGGPPVVMPLHVIVWSDGPDKISGTDDDVGSWTEGR